MKFKPSNLALLEADPDPHRAAESVFVDSSTDERVLVRVPYAARCSALFDPRGVAEMVGGFASLYARMGGDSILLARKFITSANAPVLLEGGAGCDEYILSAQAGLTPGVGRSTSYGFIRSFDGGGASNGTGGFAIDGVESDWVETGGVAVATALISAVGRRLLSTYGANLATTGTTFVQLHNSATLPAGGAVPRVTIPVDAGKPFSLDIARGRAFPAGVYLVTSTTGPTYTADAGGSLWASVELS